MRYFIILLLLFNFSFAKDLTPHLSKGEKRFKKDLSYNIKDFNLNWDITFLSVVSFMKVYNNNKNITYKDLYTIFKTDNRVYSQKDKKDIVYLANLLKNRKDYKLQRDEPLAVTNYYMVFFIDKNGKMYALENYKELKDMIGSINNPAKLLLWLKVKYRESPYSYFYNKNGLWRVRYSNWSLGNCTYYEYFKYYNKNGIYIIQEDIRDYHKKGCVDPVI